MSSFVFVCKRILVRDLQKPIQSGILHIAWNSVGSYALGASFRKSPQSIRKHTGYIYAIEFWTERIILKIYRRKLHGITDLTTCASPRPVQQHQSPRSAQYGSVTHDAPSCQAQRLLWPANLAAVKTSTVNGKRQAKSVCDWEEQVNREASFSVSNATRRLFLLIYFLIFFIFTGLLFAAFILVECYMWIVIVDHGRLRVSWQAKFLSRKYSIYWP